MSHLSLRHFTIDEFKCPTEPHYPESGMNPFLLAFVDELRDRCGFPLRVTSGYRNPQYNKSVGGASKSQHLLGNAADLTPAQFTTKRLEKLYNIAKDMSPGGLGWYPNNRFVHIDVRRGKKARWEG